ncbi:MAG: dihydrodipicolinate synthase family protein [Deltaproteobacteria bacterium]|nr:dihydrodipicolinate synthase family protein [Deltaproteobacteria bacterium]
MSSGAPIQGVHAAIPTPFDEQRGIDVKALDHLVDYLVERDLHGLALLTEVAEDVLLSAEERRAIIKAVSARLKGKRSLLVCISAPASQEAIELARFAEGKGAQAIVLQPPRVPGIGYRELYRHVDRVVRAVGLPVLLLTRPANAIEMLAPEEATALVGHPGLRGVVAPHAPPAALETWLKRFKGRDAAVLGGASLALSRTLKAGAHGVVCAMATIAAAQAAELWEAIGQADQTRIERLETSFDALVSLLGPPATTDVKDGLHKLANKIARRTVDTSLLPPTYPFALIKEALRLQGHPVRGDVRPPFEAARPEAVERLRAVLQHAGVLS